MASIVLLLSELLGGESASVLAADRYITGGRLSLGEFRPAVTEAKRDGRVVGAGTEGAREEKQQGRKEESFEDLAVSRIAVDVMWP
ncbi:hypothetical protein GQ55_5G422500 [Panicum hallii var. hallii]|jgi:hypothetical protein|uniref:Uncharacterized protein n=2 Tax=Panicum hallii TaxID=206008 RepID=A0A2T7DP29_9POAL|nr:uncharacterized protein LOC112894018 [Panicum hallii]PAN31444.1 hypothetical protein PAHAL_5G420100 [Panicum hallii]PUZ57335.1 hypothetical protein GQ55_5G422500 [Panicum hallii var. hallii]